MGKRRIFISYSHANRRWIGAGEGSRREKARYDLLSPWQKRLRNEAVFWFDRHEDERIRGGQDYTQVILDQIEAASVAILLITQSFVDSEYIGDVELPAVMKRVREGELLVLPIYVEGVSRRAMRELLEGPLEGRHILPTPDGPKFKPLLRLFQDEAMADEIRTDLLDELEEALDRSPPARRPPDRTPKPPKPVPPPAPPRDSRPEPSSAPPPRPDIPGPPPRGSHVAALAADPPEHVKPTPPTRPAPGPGFARVPAGEAVIGCKPAALASLQQKLGQNFGLDPLTRPAQTTVLVRAFEIARAPVTQAQYEAFVGGAGWPPPATWRGPRAPQGSADQPVTGITFQDACAYCEWTGGRLPTNDEWEKAARSGDDRVYPWGDAFDSRYCHASEVGATGPAPVGSVASPGNAYGLTDLAGNVDELVDGGKPFRRDQRVVHARQARGGAYDGLGEIYGISWARLVRIEDGQTSPSVGFRVARDRRKHTPPGPGEDAAYARIEGAVRVGCEPALVDELAERLRLGPSWTGDLRAHAARTLDMAPFEMAIHPVTHLQYWEFVQDQERRGRRGERPKSWIEDPALLAALSRLRGDESGRSGPTMPFLARVANHPVTGVTQAQATAFCGWLDGTTGGRHRLPSRLEWEAAARGPSGLRYPWGASWDPTICNCIEAERGDTVAVDEFPRGRSPFGCAQMAGNVSEWTSDADTVRYIKGGSFARDPEIYGMPFMEFKVPLDYEDLDCGFRIARERA